MQPIQTLQLVRYLLITNHCTKKSDNSFIVLINCLKDHMQFFHCQVLDAIVIVVSFALDISIAETDLSGELGKTILFVFLMWRMIRILNGMAFELYLYTNNLPACTLQLTRLDQLRVAQCVAAGIKTARQKYIWKVNNHFSLQRIQNSNRIYYFVIFQLWY